MVYNGAGSTLCGGMGGVCAAKCSASCVEYGFKHLPRKNSLMYIVHRYFSGATWTKGVLTYTRNIQLIVGIVWDLAVMYWKVDKGEEIAGNIIGTGLLVCYLILHRRDVRMMEAETKRKTG
jgi:hypothetical protein